MSNLAQIISGEGEKMKFKGFVRATLMNVQLTLVHHISSEDTTPPTT